MREEIPLLFKMKIEQFNKFIDKCIFITPQMFKITRLKVKNKKLDWLYLANCVVLDANFFWKFSIIDTERKFYELE